MRIKVGGAGTVELDLDGWVGHGNDGGVEVVDEFALGDFFIEVGAQKRLLVGSDEICWIDSYGLVAI